MRITKTAISGLAIALAYVASPAIAQTTATAPTAAAKVDQNAAITAFFGLSHRMASFSGMMPNPEFYAMGRQPKAK